MADVGLDPRKSRLALPGCKSARIAFCDGAKHNCTVTVDEFGAEATKNGNGTVTVEFDLARSAERELAIA